MAVFGGGWERRQLRRYLSLISAGAGPGVYGEPLEPLASFGMTLVGLCGGLGSSLPTRPPPPFSGEKKRLL